MFNRSIDLGVAVGGIAGGGEGATGVPASPERDDISGTRA
jgi:hypothetical protein